MNIDLEILDGEDFGTLVLKPGRDDSFEVSGYNDGNITIRVPLYTHEASAMIEALTPLSTRNPL